MSLIEPGYFNLVLSYKSSGEAFGAAVSDPPSLRSAFELTPGPTPCTVGPPRGACTCWKASRGRTADAAVSEFSSSCYSQTSYLSKPRSDGVSQSHGLESNSRLLRSNVDFGLRYVSDGDFDVPRFI